MSDAVAASDLSWRKSVTSVAAPAYRWRSALKHVGIAAQLGLLLSLLFMLEIEAGAGLPRILLLVFGGYLAHAALPTRYRLQFFLLLSLVAFGLVLGVGQGALVVAIALALFAICHLPVPFVWRVALLGVAGAALATMRASGGFVPDALRIPGPALAVIGSMFMFRIIIYMYDLRHEERARDAGRQIPGSQPSIWTRLSYFFLLPNVCFLLFPVVDYRTFRRTYYDSEPTAIYQKGIWWIALGLAYLLAYRFVYHFLVLAPEQVESLGHVVRFMVSSYLVYLRVVGQFHLVIGLLCLFGFNLPPAHRFFLLASSFTDFWRRARIDWKDFMVKVFYFPASVPLQRRWGTTTAVLGATLVVFVVTWLLHSYQWFWLRGDFPLSSNDAVFWGIFGTCVAVNSVLETRKRRKQSGGSANFSGAAARALKIVGMFVFLSVLWSYWSSPSLNDWIWTVSSARRAPALSYAKVLAAVTLAVFTLTLALLATARITGRRDGNVAQAPTPPTQPIIPSRLRPLGVGVLAAALLVVVLPAKQGVFGASARRLGVAIGSDRLNRADMLRMDRGYYETLLDTRHSVTDRVVDHPREAVKAGAVLPITRMRFVRRTDNLLTYELLPSYRDGWMRGYPFETNRWGMRDKEYSLLPSPGTYRIALLGASYEMGASVRAEEKFEALLEDRLNREGPGIPERRYEILNFAVGGYALPQNVVVADQKVFRHAPHALVIGVKPPDFGMGVDRFEDAVRRQVRIPYPELREKLRQAGVVPGMPEPEIRRRLRPVMPDILRWSFKQIAQLASAHGIPAVAVLVPRPDPVFGDEQRGDDLASWASEAGFSVIRLDGVFGGHAVDSVMVPLPDGHPTALGHRLIADRLYEILRDRDESLLKLGFAARSR